MSPDLSLEKGLLKHEEKKVKKKKNAESLV